MKVLMLHNRYREPGGEDGAYAADVRLLEEYGHAVVRFEATNERLASFSRPRALGRTVWSPEAAREVRRIIRGERPDLMHVHNFFAMHSPAVHHAAHSLGVPVVQTLHNYRLVCPDAKLLRDGKVCEDCLHRRLAWPAVWHGCYRESRAASVAVAAMLATHRLLGTWRRCVSKFIVLTDFSREVFVRAGFPPERLAVRGNFMLRDPGEGAGPRSGAVFVGMFHPWKDPATVIRAWQRVKTEEPLTLIGSGPEEERLRVLAGGDRRICFRGYQPSEVILSTLQQARCLIFPSVWYETFGMVIMEGFACGTPVLAARIGAGASLVAEGRTGLHFTPGDDRDLSERLQWAFAHPAELAAMGRNARLQFGSRYTREAAYEKLMRIYDDATFATTSSGESGRKDQFFGESPP